MVVPKGSLIRASIDDALFSGVHAGMVAVVAHNHSILPMVPAGSAYAVLPVGCSLARGAGARVVAIDRRRSCTSRLVTGRPADSGVARLPAGRGVLRRASRHRAGKG